MAKEFWQIPLQKQGMVRILFKASAERTRKRHS